MRRQRDPPLELARPDSPATPAGPAAAGSGPPTPAGSQETFRAQLRALDSSRSVRTRRLAAAEEDPLMVRTLKLAHILKEIHQAVLACNGEWRHGHGEGIYDLPTCCTSYSKGSLFSLSEIIELFPEVFTKYFFLQFD